MHENTTEQAISAYGPARRQQLLAAFVGRVEPIEVGKAYKIGLFAVASTMVLLPLVYLALIGGVSYATYWHAVENLSLFEELRGRTALFLYAAPLIVGLLLVFFMVKPLLAPRAKSSPVRSLSREEEPLLHAFVEKLCATVGAPTPCRIEVDCDVNASAHLRRGFRSFFGKDDLVLTIGLPLAGGLRLDQLAGVLAHEFGHFAQGAGLRLSYVIRSVNHWFGRVVYGRDRWDGQLEAAAEVDNWWLKLVVALARGAVWCSRKILAGLMYLGHAASSYLMRQMEFDADRYEARLVGAEVFASTCHELNYLGAAYQRSLGDVSASWRDGRLADSLPRLVVHHRGQLERGVVERIAAAIGGSTTSWSDTHPADSERLASARRETGHPAFRSDLPATVLFRDFQRLSREVTRGFYEDQLETAIADDVLQPADELLASRNSERGDAEALGRLLGMDYDPCEPPRLHEPAGPLDPAVAAGRLAELRRNQQEAGAQPSEEAASFLRVTEERLRLGGLQALSECEVKLKKRTFGLDDVSPAGLAARALELDFQLSRLHLSFEPALERAGERVAIALAVTALPDLAAKMEVAPLRAEIERLLPAALALGQQRDRFCRLREKILGMLSMAETLKAGELDSPNANARLEELGRSLASELGSLKLALENVSYPFAAPGKATSLGAYLLPDLAPAADLGGSFGLSRAVLGGVDELGKRIWGRLATLTEKVEDELGLVRTAPVRAAA